MYTTTTVHWTTTSTSTALLHTQQLILLLPSQHDTLPYLCHLRQGLDIHLRAAVKRAAVPPGQHNVPPLLGRERRPRRQRHLRGHLCVLALQLALVAGHGLGDGRRRLGAVGLLATLTLQRGVSPEIAAAVVFGEQSAKGCHTRQSRSGPDPATSR